MSNQPLLKVEGLKTYFFTPRGVVQAVDGIDLHLMPGETLGIVGESGSGKSVTSLSIMRLIADPGEIVEGSIEFDGVNLLDLPEEFSNQPRVSTPSIPSVHKSPRPCRFTRTCRPRTPKSAPSSSSNLYACPMLSNASTHTRMKSQVDKPNAS
jgi:ABC-type antimicrobial peptide transport system ATPase subunit